MPGGMPGERPRAIVVGAGIGGLACALALSRDGWQVDIYEQSDRLSEIGAGLQLGPNVTRILAHWGLLESLRTLAFEPQGLRTRDWSSGRELSYLPIRSGDGSIWGAPYLQLHRADLQQVLAEAALAHPHCRLHLGHAIKHVQAEDTSLDIDGQQQQADLIVGADGIRSHVRACVLPDERTRYTGQTAWRLLIPADAVPAGLIPPDACLWLGPGKHLVHYFVRGGRWINCVGVVESTRWQDQSWTRAAEFSDLAQDFTDAHQDIRQLIQAAPRHALFRWALHDRAPMPRWSRGRVVLLGDACHATLPFLAQGAAMAIEDAAVLADCLSATLTGHAKRANEDAAIRDALIRYQHRRQPRTDWIQTTSRRNGQIYHLRGLAACSRNLALGSGLASPRGIADRVYGYDALGALSDT